MPLSRDRTNLDNVMRRRSSCRRRTKSTVDLILNSVYVLFKTVLLLPITVMLGMILEFHYLLFYHGLRCPSSHFWLPTYRYATLIHTHSVLYWTWIYLRTDQLSWEPVFWPSLNYLTMLSHSGDHAVDGIVLLLIAFAIRDLSVPRYQHSGTLYLKHGVSVVGRRRSSDIRTSLNIKWSVDWSVVKCCRSRSYTEDM